MAMQMRSAMRLAALIALLPVAGVDAASTPPLLEQCHVAGTDEVLRCGDLLVPENPQQARGRKIKLHLIVSIPAISPA